MNDRLVKIIKEVIDKTPYTHKEDYSEILAMRIYQHVAILNRADVNVILGAMLDHNKELYEKILDTSPIAYYFNKLVNVAMLRDGKKENREPQEETTERYPAGG